MLTCESIKTPVRAQDGHIYEKWAIEKWLRENKVCLCARARALCLCAQAPLSRTCDAHACVYVCRIALLSPTSQSATSSRSSQTRIRLAPLMTIIPHRCPRQLPPLPPPPSLLIGWGRISHLASNLGALLQWGSSRARLSLRCGAHVETSGACENVRVRACMWLSNPPASTKSNTYPLSLPVSLFPSRLPSHTYTDFRSESSGRGVAREYGLQHRSRGAFVSSLVRDCRH